MNLKGKVIIITGSSRGIGRQLALNLAKEGAMVVLNGRNKERLEQTRLDFELKGYLVTAIAADVSSYNECVRMTEEVVKTYGRIDVVVNNGSLTVNRAITDLSPTIFKEVIDSNIYGAAFPTIAALPYLKLSQGSVVLISSLAGLHSMPSASAYSIGKMGLTALWQSLQIECAQEGIHVGIAYLGFTQNDPNKTMLNGKGDGVPVPKRPALFLQTQEKVANKLVNMIKRRRKRKVFSFLGGFASIMFRFLPGLTLVIIKQSQKNK